MTRGVQVPLPTPKTRRSQRVRTGKQAIWSHLGASGCRVRTGDEPSWVNLSALGILPPGAPRDHRNNIPDRGRHRVAS